MNCGSNDVAIHLSKACWYLDTGDMRPVEPSAENKTAMTNKGFILSWKRNTASREVQLFGRLHSDICNVLLYMLLGIRLQIWLPKPGLASIS